ncbi:hypothetical protein KKHLCK_05485 [Candidatus Electrothrix laxa]
MCPQEKLKGDQPIAILLCKLSDSDYEPQPVAWFEDLFVKQNTRGINDYWRDASFGNITLNGSKVFGWRDIGMTRQQLFDSDPIKDENGNTIGVTRQGAINAGVNAFDEDMSKYKCVIVVYNISMGGGPGGSSGKGILANSIVVDEIPGGLNSWGFSYLAHEIGHAAFGLIDSFDESPRTYDNIPGLYCDRHDIMSAMSVASFDHSVSGVNVKAGPLLNTAAMDILGWLDYSDRVAIWDPYISPGPFKLTSLSNPNSPGFIALKCGRYYIEFRTQEGWDTGLVHPTTGLAHPTVLVHRIDKYFYKGEYKGEATWVISPSPGPDNQCWNHEVLENESIELKQTIQSKTSNGSVVTHHTWTVKVISFDNNEATISIDHKYNQIPLPYGPLYREPLSFEIPPYDEFIERLKEIVPKWKEEWSVNVKKFPLREEVDNLLDTLSAADKIQDKKSRNLIVEQTFSALERTISKAKKGKRDITFGKK